MNKKDEILVILDSVWDKYKECQIECSPGSDSEKLVTSLRQEDNSSHSISSAINQIEAKSDTGTVSAQFVF